MPRTPAAAFPFISVSGAVPRLKPPPELPENARKIWITTVSALKSSHFCEADVPLLSRYCEASALASEAAAALASEGTILADGKANPRVGVFAAMSKVMQGLSLRLRLGPQSRQPNNPSRPGKPGPALSYYETMTLEEQ